VGTVGALGRGPVPFEELIGPAGAHGIRGLPDGRLRGGSGVVASAEYRWYISNRLDASLFVDHGTVAGSWLEGIGGAHWFPSFGLGLRLVGPAVPYWRAVPERGVELAYAPGSGLRILFALAAF
jgi:outer membrane protein assembly factor BamA